MKEWICEEVHAVTIDGKPVSTMLHQIHELVRCKDCKHRPKQTEPGKTVGFSLEFPDYRCPCQCDDGYYSWYPKDDWFCADGER